MVPQNLSTEPRLLALAHAMLRHDDPDPELVERFGDAILDAGACLYTTPEDNFVDILEELQHWAAVVVGPMRWTITIEASHELVRDGFNVANQVDGNDGGGELSDLGRIVDYLAPHHCRLRIIAAPDPASVRALQGYPERDPAIAALVGREGDR